MKKVILTTSWDDGHILDLRLAELLNRYNIAATFYIAPENRELKSDQILNKQQVIELSKDFEIGAHTVTHPRLSNISDTEAKQEIAGSKRILQAWLNRPVTSFCYPGGDFKLVHKKMVKDVGFFLARTVKRNVTDIGDDNFAIPTTVHAYRHLSDLKLSMVNLGFAEYLHWDELAVERFNEVLAKGGVFHLWGHSWEIDKNKDWDRLERVFKYIGNRSEVNYIPNSGLVKIPESTVEGRAKRNPFNADNGPSSLPFRFRAERLTTRQKRDRDSAKGLDGKPGIVMVCPYFPPHGGGLERYAFEVGSRLQKYHNWRVVVITSGQRRGKDITEKYDGLTVHRLSYDWKISNTTFSFKWFKKIKQILKQEQPELINIHMPVPGIGDVASYVAGKTPIIITYHTATIRKGRPLPDIFVWVYEHWPLKVLLNRASHIICSSDFVRFSFLKKYQKKSYTVPPGVDLTLFKSDREKALECPTVLFVAGLGRAEQHKGLKSLINAISIVKKTVPNIRLIVVGEGDMKNDYQAHALKLGLSDEVMFSGRLSGPVLVEAYQKSNVFALPATSDNMPTVIIEAMACGLPVVSTTVGGIPSLVEDGKTGFLIKPKDKKILAEKLTSLLTNPALALEMGEAGQKKAANGFDWYDRGEDYNKLFTQFLAEAPKFNVVQIAAYYPPHLGGLERVTEEVSRNLATDGYAVTVITSDIGANKEPKIEKIDNLTIKRLWGLYFAHTAFIPGLFWNLMRIKKPAVFHLHLAQAFVPEVMWLAAKLRGIPYVVHFHLDVEPSGKLGFLYVVWKKLVQPVIIRGAAKIITLSLEQSELIIKRYNKPSDQVKFIGNGVGAEFLKLGKGQRNLNKPLRLLFVGRLATQKRPDRLVEGLALVKADVNLIMVGDGEDRVRLEKESRSLGLKNIIFRGVLSGEDLLQAYREADVFVLPSDREGMSLALLEAMAVGLPVVASDVLGITELISGVGILVKNPSAETFAEAIDTLAKNPEQLEQLGRASFNEARKYSWEKLVKKMEQIYKEALA